MLKKSMTPDEDILTLPEMAELLKLPKSTAYKLVQEGVIPAKKVGRHWRFVRSSLIEWLKTQKPGA